MTPLIKYNDNIKSIKVDGEEYLLSQYADDTALLLDGSEKSLRSTMSVLQFYDNISGLNITIEKKKSLNRLIKRQNRWNMPRSRDHMGI